MESNFDQVKLSSLLTKVGKKVSVCDQEQYTQIGIRSHGKGIFYKEPVTGLEIGKKSVFWLEEDCFIVNIVFAWEQAIGKTTSREIGKIASHRFPMYKVNQDRLDLDYLVYFFKTTYGKYLMEVASPGGAGRNKTLGQQNFLNLKIPIPSLSEQKGIVKIFDTWGEAINKLEVIIKHAKTFHDGLMEQLLSGKKRFSTTSEEWAEFSLKDLVKFEQGVQVGVDDHYTIETESRIRFIRISDHTKENEEPRYVEKIQRMNIVDDKDVVMVRYGEAGRVVRGIEGALANNLFSIRPLNENVINDYLFFLLRGRHIQYQISTLNSSSTMPQVSHKSLYQIIVNIPPLEEQYKTAKILECSDARIKTLEMKKSNLLDQRTGLMQQLLTGKKRIKVN
jgi:type I restriction enzyme S subunit